MLTPELARVQSCLLSTGYRPQLISKGVRLWNGPGTIHLLAHSRQPKDIRTSAIAVTDSACVKTARATGAPYILALTDERWEWWRAGGANDVEKLKAGHVDALEMFFQQHREQLNPDIIYRAKTWGRMDPEARQGEFIDAGLMPLVEREVGEKARRLLEENVKNLASALEWTKLTESSADERKAEWLIKAPFWLLAAKILRDKEVPGFKRLTLTDLEIVFERLARHYQKDNPQPVTVPANRREALYAVAQSMERFASLELMSTEALGYIYESTLINKATRKRLGTHSTPAWLIDYIMGRLRPWIAEMPAEGRHIFEPACGHCGFLVAALRLLDELRPADYPEDRKTYLRRRLHGVDVDPFSQEVARLALTLADVPNPNGWDLAEEDMFSSDIIGQATRKAQIVLANPPFESFGDSRQRDWLPNKAAETFARVVDNLPEGGVFGLVVPQTLLANKQGARLRQTLLASYEISEITLFADKLFEFGESESAVIIGRKARGKTHLPILYQRVREEHLSAFATTLEPSSRQTVVPALMPLRDKSSLLIPELMDIWEWLAGAGLRTLNDVAHVGQGFFHKGANNPTLPKDAIRESSTFFAGAVEGFAGWVESQQTHFEPRKTWLNLDPDVIDRAVNGLTIGTPQVLLNYIRVSRESWRLKALIDEEGHAVTSDFLVVRPRTESLPLTVLWAILNSPLGNAFAYCHSDKRQNLTGTLRQMPLPDLASVDLRPLTVVAEAYLKAARAWSQMHQASASEEQGPLFAYAEGRKSKLPTRSPTEDELRQLHWRVDAEVMRLYVLPPELERKVLDLFAGVERRGVPFRQTEYYPQQFRRLQTMAELLVITSDWEQHARRKSALIEKKVQRRASASELQELKELKRIAGARTELLAPMPIAEWRALHDALKRELASTKE